MKQEFIIVNSNLISLKNIKYISKVDKSKYFTIGYFTSDDVYIHFNDYQLDLDDNEIIEKLEQIRTSIINILQSENLTRFGII